MYTNGVQLFAPTALDCYNLFMGIRNAHNIQLKRKKATGVFPRQPAHCVEDVLDEIKTTFSGEMKNSEGFFDKQWKQTNELTPEIFEETIKSMTLGLGLGDDLQPGWRNLNQYQYIQLEEGVYIYALRQVHVDDGTNKEHYYRLSFGLRDSKDNHNNKHLADDIAIAVWQEDGKGLYFGKGRAKLVLQRGHSGRTISAEETVLLHELERWISRQFSREE